MTHGKGPSVHASAVLVGDRAILIRGPSGSGKSRLAFDLILAGRSGQIPPAVLVGDDRVHLEASQGQIVVRPARELAGLIEIRGLGIRRWGFVGEAVVGLVIGSMGRGRRAPAGTGGPPDTHSRYYVTSNPRGSKLRGTANGCSYANDNREYRLGSFPR